MLRRPLPGRERPIVVSKSNFIAPVFDTTPPGVRAATDGPRWRASRESHPSEDLSELPPLLVAVAGQEYHYQIADEGRAGITGCNARQPATGCFVDGWVPLCTFLGRLKCRFLHRWSWRILQCRFGSFSRASHQRTYPAAGYSVFKELERFGKLPILPIQSKLGQDAVQHLKILPIQ